MTILEGCEDVWRCQNHLHTSSHTFHRGTDILTIQKLLTLFEQKKIEYTLGDDGKLNFSRGVLSDDDRAGIREHKAALIERLSSTEKKPNSWRFTDSPEVQRRLARGWRLIGERCITDGTYFYSERVGWTQKPKPSAIYRAPVKFPSAVRMRYAYQWLRSFNMTERFTVRCTSATKCRFLIDWLPDDLRKEFDEHNELGWREWREIYTQL